MRLGQSSSASPVGPAMGRHDENNDDQVGTKADGGAPGQAVPGAGGTALAPVVASAEAPSATVPALGSTSSAGELGFCRCSGERCSRLAYLSFAAPSHHVAAAPRL